MPSKQAWLYVFDRVTGEPIWPIEEKPVPKGDVPGEWYAPTQPHPTSRARCTAATRSDSRRSDRLHAGAARAGHGEPEALQVGGNSRSGTLYNPPIVGNVNGLLGAINMGNANGGTNWPGGGADPETASSSRRRTCRRHRAESVAPPPAGFSDIPYQAGVVGSRSATARAAGTGTYADAPPRRRAAPQRAAPAAAEGAAAGRGGRRSARRCNAVEGLSIVKPPYGVLAAIDLDKGAMKWQVPHGDTPDAVRNHPLLKGHDHSRRPARAAASACSSPRRWSSPATRRSRRRREHPRGAMLRAYDKETGKEVGAVWMPAPQSGSPMTYMAGGRQFIVVAVSGGNYSGEYIAFGFPAAERDTGGGTK